MKKLCFIIIVFIKPALLLSQSFNHYKLDSTEITYIQKFNKHIAPKLIVVNNIENFIVNSEPNKLLIYPNAKVKTKIGINYRSISASIGFSPEFLPGNNDDSRKGKTKISSLTFNIFTQHWIQSFAFNQTKGFYLLNTQDFIPDWDSDSDQYILFPELNYFGLYGLTGYKFNKKFSLKALSTQTERQLKSAGSFIPIFWYRYYIMDNRIELTGQNSSQKSNNLEAILQLSYIYTYVIRHKFYLSAGATAGGGLIHIKLLTRFPEGNFIDYNNNPIFRIEGQISLGYNSEHFFSGIQAIGDAEQYKQGNSSSTISNDMLTFQVFIGYRFASPKFLDKFFDKKPFNMF